MWDWKHIHVALLRYRRYRVMFPSSTAMIQDVISLCVHKHAKELDEEDTVQELWIHVLSYISPRVTIRIRNFPNWLITRLRWKITHLKKYDVVRKTMSYTEGECDGKA